MTGELKRSGLGVGAFASLHGLDPQRVYYWSKRAEGPARPAALVEFRIPRMLGEPVTTRPERIEIELANGHRLLVAETVDEQALQRVVGVLVAAC